jgi:hypothetical protein
MLAYTQYENFVASDPDPTKTGSELYRIRITALLPACYSHRHEKIM